MRKHNEIKSLLTAVDVAGWLGCSKKTVYELCKRNEIPNYKLAVGYRFNEDELREWLEKQSTPS